MKSTAEKIAVMQAYLDGKTVVRLDKTGKGPPERPVELRKNTNPVWDWNEYDYQVEPTEEEYTQKAVELYYNTAGHSVVVGGWAKQKSMRAVIDAVKRGEIK